MKEPVSTQHPTLSRVKTPGDLRNLSTETLRELAGEIRDYIIEVVTRNGGHLASNLGVVELTIALHRVFDSPTDKLVWDVGHQSYAHKLLTGRSGSFPTLRRLNGLSGFPKREESLHDIVETGHASTSISSALGILMAQRIRGERGKVVAVIGDGALTGGIALEGLNQAGHLRNDLIIVLNDNHMSIGRNVGAISAYLSRLTTTSVYRGARKLLFSVIRRIPVVGKTVTSLLRQLEISAQAFFTTDTLFFDFGFTYIGPIDGHDIPLMMRVLRNVKRLDRPCVVHVKTLKGKGYPPAEENPTSFHGVSPYAVIDKELEMGEEPTFTEAFSSAVASLAERDRRVVGVSAAMTDSTGLRALQTRHPGRFFDVGISEQHAVTFAAGMARAGMKPVVAIYSTFMQRAVDQVIHDVALPGLPVVIAVDRAGLVGGDGETHQGMFDISLFRCIPGITMLAPSSRRELELMLLYAFNLDSPVMIRYPKARCGPEFPELSSPIQTGRGVFLKRCDGRGTAYRGTAYRRTRNPHADGSVLFLVLGSMVPVVSETAALLEKRGVPTDVYVLRFISPLDGEYLAEITASYSLVVTVEDGLMTGGIGERILGLLKDRRDCLVLGIPDRFIPQGTRSELLELCGLSVSRIASAVENALKTSTGFSVREGLG